MEPEAALKPNNSSKRKPMSWMLDDGGRAAAGYRGKANDCVTRAIAIATGRPYQDVYDGLNALAARERPRKRGGKTKARKRSSARTGIAKPTMRRYMREAGWTWVPTMNIGSGCRVHLRAGELPDGPIVAALSKHVTAVIHGVVHDLYDPCRGGTRCVYGYWTAPPALPASAAPAPAAHAPAAVHTAAEVPDPRYGSWPEATLLLELSHAVRTLDAQARYALQASALTTAARMAEAPNMLRAVERVRGLLIEMVVRASALCERAAPDAAMPSPPMRQAHVLDIKATRKPRRTANETGHGDAAPGRGVVAMSKPDCIERIGRALQAKQPVDATPDEMMAFYVWRLGEHLGYDMDGGEMPPDWVFDDAAKMVLAQMMDGSARPLGGRH